MATEAEINQIVEHYKDLLLEQYVNATRATETIGALTKTAVVDLVELEVQNAFNIDTASGPQLDVLGQYIGFSRTIATEIDRFYFTMVDYDNPTVSESGFTDYTNSELNAGSSFYLYAYNNTSFTDLPDDLYRPLLRLKMILNRNLNTMESIADALWTSFGPELIAYDNRDMTMLYLINYSATNLVRLAISTGLLPKPMGVRISGVFALPDTEHVFGFYEYEYNNGNSLGFSTYETGFNGQFMLNYSDRIF
jgi:hypothetical protein